MRPHAFVSLGLLLALSPHAAGDPPCATQETHYYVVSAAPTLDTAATGGVRNGAQIAKDANLEDCDGDGVPGDWDGDADLGPGTAYLPASHHAGERICVWDESGAPVHFFVANDEGDGAVGWGGCLDHPGGDVWVTVEAGLYEVAPGILRTSAPTRGLVAAQ